MRKILMSLLSTLAIAAVVVGASQAVFSDTHSITGNTIAAGTLTFDLRGFTGNKPIGTIASSSTHMVPGQWTDWGKMEIFNHSDSVQAKVYMYLANVSGGACPKTNLKVTTGYAGGDEFAHVLYNGSVSGLTGSGSRIQTTVAPPFDVLGTNTSQVLHQTAQLDPTADNSYQGNSCSWDEVFVAESAIPSPTPNPAP